MSSPEDHQLLQAYASEGSQTAFARLVERHLPLVWSAAQRQVCDEHLAQDVSQQVFTLLAQKAATMGPETILSGWLYRTTGHVAARMQRGEFRRREREQSAFNAMNDAHSEPSWQEIEPLLDEAMTSLSETDRDAVVLRYFENKSLQEVGSAIGSSEDAAQKRLARAVEKLRSFLGKRGKAMSTGSFIAVLSVGAVQPAPAMLAATISTAALAGAVAVNSTVTLTALKLMTTATLKPILATGAALAAAVVVVVQHNQAGTLRQQNEALQAQVQKAETASAEISDQLQKATTLINNDPNLAELARLRAETARLRGLEAELAKVSAQAALLEKQRQVDLASQAAAEEAVQKFDAERAVTVNALKHLGMQMHMLRRSNNPNAVFAADGSLNPGLLAKSLPDFDLKKVEMLVADRAQLDKVIAENPTAIVSRTRKAIATPDGRWLRIYALADGSVLQRSTENADEAFGENWRLEQLKSAE